MVAYTITVANSGPSPYTGASFTAPLDGVTDDAAYNNNAAASAGTVTYTSSGLTWTGDVPANGTVTITYPSPSTAPTPGTRS